MTFESRQAAILAFAAFNLRESCRFSASSIDTFISNARISSTYKIEIFLPGTTSWYGIRQIVSFFSSFFSCALVKDALQVCGGKCVAYVLPLLITPRQIFLEIYLYVSAKLHSLLFLSAYSQLGVATANICIFMTWHLFYGWLSFLPPTHSSEGKLGHLPST